MDVLQAPPHSIELEQNIIGALLKDATHSNCREIIDLLPTEAFYLSSHRTVYGLIGDMLRAKAPVDLMTVSEELENHGLLADCGGFIYLAETVKNTVTLHNLEAYSFKIIEYYQYRQIASIAQNAISNELNTKPDELIEYVCNELKQVEQQTNSNAMSHISDISSRFIDALEKRIEAGDGIIGYSTGIDVLDEAFGGINEDALVVIAGRPSHGKTSFAQALAENIGIYGKPDHFAHFVSMEMGDTSIYERFASSVSGVNANHIRRGQLTDQEWAQLGQGMETLNQSRILLTDEPALTVGQIRGKVRANMKQHNARKGAIFVDYLGLMKLPKADRHDIAIGIITRSLKELAKELQMPVFLLVQANRAADGKRPTMSNLKDSSSIEADADLVLFVHREEVANPETPYKGITEIISAKDRHNNFSGTVYLERLAKGYGGVSAEHMGALENALPNPKKGDGFEF